MATSNECVEKCPMKKDSMCVGKIKQIIPKSIDQTDNEYEEMIKTLKTEMDSKGIDTKEKQVLFFGQLAQESGNMTNLKEDWDYKDPYLGAYLDRKALFTPGKDTTMVSIYKNNLAIIDKNEKEIEKNTKKIESINSKLSSEEITKKEKNNLINQSNKLVKDIEKKSKINQDIRNRNEITACKINKTVNKLKSNNGKRLEYISDVEKEIETLEKLNKKTNGKEIERLGRKLDKANVEKAHVSTAYDKVASLQLPETAERNCSYVLPSDYLGRGGIQITGEDNYKAFFKQYNENPLNANKQKLNYNSESDLEKVAEDRSLSIQASVWFFRTRCLDGKGEMKLTSKSLTANQKARLINLQNKNPLDAQEKKELLTLKTINVSAIVNGANPANHLDNRIKYTDKYNDIANAAEPCELCNCSQRINNQ